ncbi:MAG TPA: PepSY domain-containing protein [Burkholderiales bacterium]|nr:PepSY domain-containing protein [Burkholderiales bacterium]
MKLSSAFRMSVLAFAIAAAPAFAMSAKALEHADKVLEGAKTTLSQAISTAETEVGGKALSARLARSHKQDFYEVHVVKGDQLTDVHVAIDDGKVLSSRPLGHRHMEKGKGANAQSAEQPATKN